MKNNEKRNYNQITNTQNSSTNTQDSSSNSLYNSIRHNKTDQTKKQKTLSGENIDGMIYFNMEINDIDDLIFLGKQYRPGKKYNINVEKLYKLIPVLTKLKKVIGMETVKKTIINQIIYFIQDFQDKNSDMLHTVIQGPPGVGKTMLGEIIGEIYYKLEKCLHLK
jgi:ATP-dependent Clp protease ATP-binding subunit ClpA